MNQEIRYRLEGDMNITDLSVEYLGNKYYDAVNHFKNWLRNKNIFNECLYKVTYENGIEKEKTYIPILSKNANIILHILKNDEEGFLPMNMDTEIDKMTQVKAMNELINNGIVKIRKCEGSAIELI
jgi:hypothetical protein